MSDDDTLAGELKEPDDLSSGERRLLHNLKQSQAMKDSDHPGRELDEETAVEIRERYGSGEIDRAQLARDYDVSVRVIASVVKGETYRRAGGPTVCEYAALSSESVASHIGADESDLPDVNRGER